MGVQSWQIPCPRCGFANSGAHLRCSKCGQPLGGRPGMLVAGQSLSSKGERPVSTKVAKPGGFLPRLIALIIDSLILLVILFPVMTLWTLQLTPAKVENGAAPSGLDTVRGSLSLQLTLMVLYLFYFAGSWTIMGATPGQLLMSLRVTDQNAAGIGFFRAVLRYLLYVLLSPLAVVSALMVGVSKNKRALHDLLAGTYVIQVVDRDDLLAESTGLPAAFGGGGKSKGVAPGATAPSPVPDEPPAAYAAPPAATTYAPAPTAGEYSPPPATTAPASARAAAVPPLDFPAMPMMGAAADVPPPPGHEAPAGGMDAGLYAPPPMVDASTSHGDFNAPPPTAPADREIYTPQPSALDPRAARSTEQFAPPPDLSAPPPPPPPPPGAVAPAPAPAPKPDGEVPPFEFPPMAPPPEPHK